MRYLGSTGCPFRREMFQIEQRQCDGCEISTTDALSPLQRPLSIWQTYNANDVM